MMAREKIKLHASGVRPGAQEWSAKGKLDLEKWSLVFTTSQYKSTTRKGQSSGRAVVERDLVMGGLEDEHWASFWGKRESRVQGR